ncbi:hypothetical protein R1sor_016625 [Riccia sorocarpa]|uniref:Reverse transcriptase domain-containing protein n=1 Tax=Riccia sorocarpa TaxID=122646 RepID=A0ABD3HHF1_9MARC
MSLLRSAETSLRKMENEEARREEEVERIVKMMKADKSLGLDGLTVEAFVASWDFVSRDCNAMISHFWDTGKLIQGPRTAVIKLVPKNAKKDRLENWRPLSLMSLSYKIIAKIVAERIKKFLPQLVDVQQAKKAQGRIQGLTTRPGESLLHQLFADDTGIFPRGCCRIANAEDMFMYLGVLVGVNVLDEEITADIKLKYERRINHWATKLLTWPAKLILCRNMLGALPYYTLMTVGLSTQGMTLLQKATRDFLWGQNEMGRNKKPLIAWKHFERRKEDGGLGWPPLKDMAAEFMLTNVMKILTGADEDWVQMAREIIHKELRQSSRPNVIKTWTIPEVLLRLDSFRVKPPPHAFYSPDTYQNGADCRDDWRARSGSAARSYEKDQIKDTYEIHSSRHLNNPLEAILEDRRVPITPELRDTTIKLEGALPTNQMGPVTWEDCHGWSWDGENPSGEKAWQITAAQWRRLLYTCDRNDSKLSCSWETTHNQRQWQQRWKRLWGGPTHIKTKIRVWRYLHKGYFTNSKAKDWGIADGICRRCNMELETYVHAV